MTFTRTLATLAALTLSLPSSAHHAMDKATPGTLVEGLLSGFGHPIIGLDHLLFVIAIGIAVYHFGRAAAHLALFLGGSIVGTLLHLAAPGLPYAEACVAATLVLLGVLLFRRSVLLEGRGAMLLFALSGIAHGYAYGEAIVGAEATPLLAYLAGFTLVQFAIGLGGYVIARYLAVRRPRYAFVGAAGSVLTVAGAGFLLMAMLPQ